jgi:hypothetical protein
MVAGRTTAAVAIGTAAAGMAGVVVGMAVAGVWAGMVAGAAIMRHP